MCVRHDAWFALRQQGKESAIDARMRARVRSRARGLQPPLEQPPGRPAGPTKHAAVACSRVNCVPNTFQPSRDPSTGWWCHSAGDTIPPAVPFCTRFSARLKRVQEQV